MKTITVCILVSLVLFSCGTGPEPSSETVLPAPEISIPITGEDADFDPGTITQEVKDSTMSDVQKFIEKLNAIIRAGDYNSWVSHLGERYFDEISSPEYLAQISEQPRIKSSKNPLSGPDDYFARVVVPSRANDRVDDIEFVTKNRVKAFTITPNGRRLRLYELEQANEDWKIIN
ncbi:MAG: hypothetical protein LBI86_04045 [Treponema sp.]|jgi:hypothetical protein|nr:hypothetical protein [Treponema sp.]